MPSDILIIPNRSSTSAAPVIQFSGSQANTIRLEVLTSGSIAFLGKSGSLFSISDNLSGSLMAVSDISGLPILEVFSDDRVVMGRYNTNALVVTGSKVGIGKSVPNISVALDVSGSAVVTGSLSVSREFSSNALWTNASSISYWGGFPTAYGVLTWNTGYATVAANTGNNLYLSANGATSTGHITITTNGDIAINKTTANAKLDVSGNTIITGSLTVTGSDAYINGVRVGRGGGNIDGNLAVGASALTIASTALYNVAVGQNTLNQLTAGNYNTAVGYSALFINTGGNNTAVGAQALGNQTSGQYNTAIGSSTGGGITTGQYNTIIGAQISGLASSLSNTVIIGDGQGNIRMYTNSSGNTAIGKTSPINAKLDINGDTTITGSLRVTGDVVSSNTSNILHPFLFITFL